MTRQVCDNVVRKALKKRKIIFRRLRSKPLLTGPDIKKRFKFAKKYRHKTRGWWCRKVQLHIDLKNFKVLTTVKSRNIEASREIRGAYREEGQGLDEAYVVLPKGLQYNTGAKSCRIAAGIGGGRVRLWHEVGKKWSGKVCADFYKGPLRAALRRGWPKRRSWQAGAPPKFNASCQIIYRGAPPTMAAFCG